MGANRGDEEYEFDYLGDRYKGGQHRKLIACLSEEELRNFVDNTLDPYYVEATAGMIGGMVEGGMTLRLMPAFSLSPEHIDINVINQNAYVCPLTETEEGLEFFRSKNEDEIIN